MPLTISNVPGAVSPSSTGAPLPRVLYVIALDPSDKFGSLEEQMLILAQAFQQQGSLFLPLFICPASPTKPTPLQQHGLSLECLDLTRFGWKTLSHLLALIGQHRIDAVHWNFSPPLGNSYLWWLSLLRPRVKHYFTDHNSRFLPLPGAPRGVKKLCKSLLLKRYSRVVCISQFVLECLQNQRVWSNLVCCRHFINPERFQPDTRVRALLRARHRAEDRFVLLTVAHLIKAKGVDVILRALKLLPESVVLWIIGGGAEAEALRQTVRELGLAQRTRFHGLQRNVEPFMQAADCFVCPSLWAEAAGLVNLEAQAAGLPVLASKVGGIPEYVLDGVTGLLFAPGDHAALADRVRRLFDDPSLCRRFGLAARAFAQEQFSPQARLADYLNVYRS